MNSDFEPPSKSWSLLATVGGVVTALCAIAGLNSWSKNFLIASNALLQKQQTLSSQTKLTQAIKKLDAKSVVLPGKPISQSELTAATTPYVAPGVGTLTQKETAIATSAAKFISDGSKTYWISEERKELINPN